MDKVDGIVSYLYSFFSPAGAGSNFEGSSDIKLGGPIVDKISLNLKPASVTAIMGLGPGPKSLLKLIALRHKFGIATGKILYDGVERSNDFYKDIAFIHDVGIFDFDGLSVFDYLYYGAKLRIEHSATECRERARQAAKALDLQVATKLGKLTKGELRLLAIATELVANPTLMCIVDPTGTHYTHHTYHTHYTYLTHLTHLTHFSPRQQSTRKAACEGSKGKWGYTS